MERLGLGPEVLLSDNPKLVYGRMTGWGQDGPMAQTNTLGVSYSYAARQQIGNFLFAADKGNNRIRVLNSNTMDQIAVINIKNGEVKPHGGRALTTDEVSVIEAWMHNRRKVLATRDLDDIHRAVDHLNLTTQWAQSRATDDQSNDLPIIEIIY